MSYRDDAFQAFESDAARKQQTSTLESLKQAYPPLARYRSIADLLDVLRNGDGEDGPKDEALLTLVAAHKSQPRSGAFTLLVVAMLPALDRMYKGRIRGVHSDDRNELWSRILAAFAEAVDNHPDRTTEFIAGNLYYGTLHALERQQCAEFLAADGEQLLDKADSYLARAWRDDMNASGLLGLLVARDESVPADATSKELDAVRHRLDRWKRDGRIDDDDYVLLLRVLVQKDSIAEAAKAIGIPVDTAKKRLQRARARLRKRDGLTHKRWSGRRTQNGDAR
jgi:hypothetical protein